MNLSLIRSMTRSAVFELENGLCFRPAHPFVVTLNGKTVYEACNTNVFSLFSLLPGTEYTVGVQAEGETLSLTFVTEAESFFVDASRYGLVADGETDNTGKLQAALSTCPKGGTVYVPAGRYRTASLFLKSNTTLYLEKGAVLLGDNDRTHYPILPGVLPSENEVDEYYLTGWEGNPLNSFAGLLNITQVHDVVVTGEGTLDCDAQNGDWWVDPKVKRIAWRPRAVAMVDSEKVCLHGITVQNSYPRELSAWRQTFSLSTAATARGRHAMRLILGVTHQSPFWASQARVPSPVTTTSCTCVMFSRPAKLSSGLPSQPVR